MGVAAISPVVTDTLVKPDLTPITRATVEIRLFLNGADGVAYLASSEIFPKVTLHPDTNGLISVTLPANSTLTPANSYYQAIFSIPGELPRIETFQVPAGAGPYLLGSLLVVPPASGLAPAAYLSDDLPLALAATALAGDDLTASRDDHVHPWTGLATDAELATHVADSNPHPNYATDTDLAGHVAAADPHPGYLTPVEGNAAYSVLAHTHSGVYDPAGTAASAVSTHAGLADPHPVYLTAAEGNAAYETVGAVATHAGLADPHPVYLTQTEGDARYGQIAALNTWALAQTFTGQILAADGAVGTPSWALANSPTTGIYRFGADKLGFAFGGVRWATWNAARLLLEGRLAWGASDTEDLSLQRDAANILAQRNGATAQAFKVYTSFVDTSNYGRMVLDTNSSSPGLFYERAGSVGALDMYVLNRANAGLSFGTNGNTRWSINNSAGHFSAQGGNWNIWNGTSALATTATAGFLGVNSCAGPPTGVPTSPPTGQIPLVFDSTNLKLYAYVGGAWKASAAYS